MKMKPEENNIPEQETVETDTAPQQEAEVEKSELDIQIEALTAELAASRDQHLRMAAEYENYRKRSAREREALYSDVTAQTILAMLPVLDNLERAVAQPTADEAFAKGVSMTLEQFYDCLKKLGVKEIEALGQQFDPNLHNAVMHVEQEGCDDNTVVEVFQKGFIMGEKVIRYSIVKVAN